MTPAHHPFQGCSFLSGPCSPRCSLSEPYSSLGASKAILAFGSHSCPPRKPWSPITCDEEAFGPSPQLHRQVPHCQACLLFADDSICRSKGPALGGQWVGGGGCEPDSRGHVEKAAQRGGIFQPFRLLGCNFLNQCFNSRVRENHTFLPHTRWRSAAVLSETALISLHLLPMRC